MSNTNRQYLVSVITPCRETKLPLLEKALASLKDQSLGFEKIEWIIVVHNSSSQNLKQVEKMVAPYPNIRIYMLQNDFQTPSSPKNYALERVKGTFVTFLDADDSFTKNFLEEAISHFTDNSVDAVFCSYKTMRTDDSEQLKIKLAKGIGGAPVQIIECGFLNNPDFMQGAELTVTGKVYRYALLQKHNIYFDTDVPIAEDNLFNLHFLKYGRKFCLLKDFEGYLYFLHQDSAIQNLKKTSEQVMACGMGFIKVLSFGVENGFFMDNILLDLIGYQSALILICPDLSMKQRRILKKAYAPYIEMLPTVKPSARYDKALLKTLKLLPKIMIQHPRTARGLTAVMRFFKIDLEQKIRNIHPDT